MKMDMTKFMNSLTIKEISSLASIDLEIGPLNLDQKILFRRNRAPSETRMKA